MSRDQNKPMEGKRVPLVVFEPDTSYMRGQNCLESEKKIDRSIGQEEVLKTFDSVMCNCKVILFKQGFWKT